MKDSIDAALVQALREPSSALAYAPSFVREVER